MKVNLDGSTWIVKFHHEWFDDNTIHTYKKAKYRGATDCVIKTQESVLSRSSILCSKDEANFNKKVGRFLALMKALQPFNKQTKQEVMKQYKKEHQLPSRKDFEQLRKSQ